MSSDDRIHNTFILWLFINYQGKIIVFGQFCKCIKAIYNVISSKYLYISKWHTRIFRVFSRLCEKMIWMINLIDIFILLIIYCVDVCLWVSLYSYITKYYIDNLLPRIAPLAFKLFLRVPQNKIKMGSTIAVSHLHGDITE